MRFCGPKYFISQVRDEWGYPTVIQDINTGKQHLIMGREFLAEIPEDEGEPVEPWDGNLTQVEGYIFLYDSDYDGLEDFYDTLEEMGHPTEFPRIQTPVDRRREREKRAGLAGSKVATNADSSKLGWLLAATEPSAN